MRGGQEYAARIKCAGRGGPARIATPSGGSDTGYFSCNFLFIFTPPMDLMKIQLYPLFRSLRPIVLARIAEHLQLRWN